MAHPAQLGFQDAASPILEELLNLHDYAMMVAFIISIFVLYIIILVTTTPLTHTGTMDAQVLETLWTILPAAILVLIALPSLRILYLMDEITSPHLTIKAIGHQWYWSYEYTDYGEQTFDSYMVPTQDLKPGHQRLLEVDYRMLVPIKAPIRMLISASDVLHSWAVPSLGVKTDAVPGRLNQTTFTPSRPGLYYGQCSEICGANHSFMPITVEVARTQEYERWAELLANAENTI